MEKRSSQRHPVTLTAHCRIGHRYVRDPVADLSTTGLYLRTRELAKEGAPVRVALALPSDDGPSFCTLAGRVVRLDRDARGILRGLGVSFSDAQIEPYEREKLTRFLRTSTGSSAVD